MLFRRALIFSLAVFMAALMISEAFAGGFSISGIGARARSMGGAFRGVADDWSATYYNPAGLAKIEQSQLSMNLDFNYDRSAYDPNVTSNDYSFGYPEGERYPNDIVVFLPNFGAVVAAPFGLPVAAGFSVSESYDENLEWDIYRFPAAYDSIQSKLPNIDFRNNFDVLDFRAAFATSFADDRFHAGLGFVIHRGDLRTSQIFLKPSTVGEPFNMRPYDYYPNWYSVDVYGLGFGFNLGLLYDINDKLSVGVSYQSESKVCMEGDGITKFFSPDNDYLQGSFNQWYGADGADTVFSGHTFETAHEVEIDMTLPSSYGFGIAFHPSEYVTLAADFSMTAWSDFDLVDISYTRTRGLTGWTVVDENLLGDYWVSEWDDAMRLSLGFEGQPSDMVKLRAGYSFDQSPVPDEQATPLIGDTGDRHHLSGGISYFYKKFEFSFAGEFVSMPERDVTELSDVNDDGVWDNLSGTYTNSAFNTSFSVTLRF